jgi:hypothetical protein
MMNNNNPQQQLGKTSTSTQIRNMYSDGCSYMNIKFYNTNLSFQLYPFINKDSNGRSNYDTKHGQQTTINYEAAFALYKACDDIINGTIKEMNMSIPCIGGSLTLERKLGTNGQMETVFTINKNNMSIPFKFNTIQYQTKENGQIVQKTSESGLGAFMCTIKGYLDGVNADRHLDKLTEDYIKANNQNNNQQNQPQNQQRPYNNNNNNNYRGGNNYRKPYNGNNNNYRKNNNNNNWSAPSQSIDDYDLPM